MRSWGLINIPNGHLIGVRLILVDNCRSSGDDPNGDVLQMTPERLDGLRLAVAVAMQATKYPEASQERVRMAILDMRGAETEAEILDACSVLREIYREMIKHEGEVIKREWDTFPVENNK